MEQGAEKEGDGKAALLKHGRGTSQQKCGAAGKTAGALSQQPEMCDPEEGVKLELTARLRERSATGAARPPLTT